MILTPKRSPYLILNGNDKEETTETPEQTSPDPQSTKHQPLQEIEDITDKLEEHDDATLFAMFYEDYPKHIKNKIEFILNQRGFLPC